MRTVVVVMSDVLDQCLLELLAPEDEDPIGALSADGADEPFGERVRSWRSNGVLMTLMPSVRNTSSKLEVNLVSRSRMMHVADWQRAVRSKLRFVACWVAHSPTGLKVMPDR